MQCTQSIFGILPANNLKHNMNLNITMLAFAYNFNFLSALKCAQSECSISLLCVQVNYIDLCCWSWSAVNLYNLLQLIVPTTACNFANSHSRQVNLREQITQQQKKARRENSTQFNMRKNCWPKALDHSWFEYICFCVVNVTHKRTRREGHYLFSEFAKSDGCCCCC